ncbi:MAG: DNA alkylation repair protein [bacterium]|nr:DNA alkylation repair protein [bacterium]
MNLEELKNDLRSLADKSRIPDYQRFFKTGKGEYGEGDIFLGIVVPNIRKVARKYKELDVADISKLVSSQVHEERFCALVIMTLRYPKDKDTFYNLYLQNLKYINNWDLVDVTCPRIVGDYLLDKPRYILYKFAKSQNLWQKRIAIISTFMFIRNDDFDDTLNLSEILLHDKHDLIHKAVGWSLREVGNRAKVVEVDFLKRHYKTMPRTALRYAIEKFPEDERKKYLKGDI